MQKRKKKEKFFMGRFACGFPISGDKKGEKINVLFFSVRGERKCETNYKRKENSFFSFRELFHYFWSLLCRKR